MPIYAYRCAACGHAKDVLQKISDPVLNVCPVCGADLTYQDGSLFVCPVCAHEWNGEEAAAAEPAARAGSRSRRRTR